jgi:excisionase family DNA binding protein
MELRLSNESRMLTPGAAAEVAGCSVKTIRRAYSAGTLVAYRDGGGRGVRIRYGDLRDWMMAEVVSAVEVADGLPGGLSVGGRVSRVRGGNMELLLAARDGRATSVS